MEHGKHVTVGCVKEKNEKEKILKENM